MPNITELTFQGDWRIIVQSRDAGWNQRVVVEGAEGGTRILGGTSGMTLDVHGLDQAPWTLRIEHDPGSGWAASWLRPEPRTIAGASITQIVGSEDVTTASSDRDFNDLIIRLEKLGMVDQPQRPFAVWPGTLQMTPEGLFETSFGRYFMAVRVRNVWTERWAADARVGLTDACRSWLAAGGVNVVDVWTTAEQEAVGQDVAGGGVLVGELEPWESRLVYFKVDVSAAVVRKHQVEIAVVEPMPEDPGHLNRRARAPIFVSRTRYDRARGVFVSECDRGTLTVAMKELVVDQGTLLKAVGRAHEIFRGVGSPSGEPGDDVKQHPCSPKEIERLRGRLRAFVQGEDDDVCGIWRDFQRCCEGAGEDGGWDEDWTKDRGNGLEMFVWPTAFEYVVDYRPDFEGQYGPIPYDDPWWKVLLLIVAAILALAAFLSAASDLANGSADTVIGTVTRSVNNALTGATAPAPPPAAAMGSVDAAVVTLNGSRGLTPALFSYLDAAADEANTAPIVALGGRIDTPGTFLTNAQIATLFADLAAAPPGSPAAAAAAALRVFKSGARTGVTNATMASILPVAPRTDGTTIFFLNQVRLVLDPSAPVARIGRPGDSGSLWLQMGTNAVAGLNHAGCTDPTTTPPTNFADMSRIEDVLTTMGVRF